MARKGVAPPPTKGRILEWLDVLAKLVGALAVLVVALFANSLQSRLTGVSIQSQREQAESQLRATMFSSLISPIAGPQKSELPMSVDREVVLTKLLALNFNANFEMKPLMEDAINRLTAEQGAKSKDSKDPREALWSIARRIAERQKASIAKAWSPSKSTKSSGILAGSIFRPWRSAAASASSGCYAYALNLDGGMERHEKPVSPDVKCRISATFGDIVDLKSPDGNYTLRTVANSPNWSDQTTNISVQLFPSEQIQPEATDTQYNFELTWLDLPLTDNTLLPDGNRFAMYLRKFYAGTSSASIMIVWFPKGYFTPLEMPLNYSEVQELLGRKQQ